MKWAPAKFRKGKGVYADVWVHVGDDGKPLKGEGNLVPMRYSDQLGAEVYRSGRGRISRAGTPVELDEGVPAAGGYDNAIDRNRAESARCLETFVQEGLWCFPAVCLSCDEQTVFSPVNVDEGSECREPDWECPECGNVSNLVRIRDPEQPEKAWVSEVEIIMGYAERGNAIAVQKEQEARSRKGKQALIVVAVLLVVFVVLAFLGGAAFFMM